MTEWLLLRGWVPKASSKGTLEMLRSQLENTPPMVSTRHSSLLVESRLKRLSVPWPKERSYLGIGYIRGRPLVARGRFELPSAGYPYLDRDPEPARNTPRT